MSSMNKNGEKLVGMCVKRRLCIGNICFKKDIHKFAWKSGVNGQLALLDYVCVRVVDRERLIDVNVLRGAAGGMSDHYLVEIKLKIKGGVVKRRVCEKAVLVIRHIKLEDVV